MRHRRCSRTVDEEVPCEPVLGSLQLLPERVQEGDHREVVKWLLPIMRDTIKATIVPAFSRIERISSPIVQALMGRASEPGQSGLGAPKPISPYDLEPRGLTRPSP